MSNVDQFPPGFVPAGESTSSLGAAFNVAQEAAQRIQQAEVTPPVQPEPQPAQVESPGQATTQAVAPENNNQASSKPAEVKPEPANFDEATLQRALEVASGGKLKSPNDLQSLFEAQQQKALIEAKLADLEVKANVNPFVSPISQKVNELLANGASTAEVEHFIKIQNLDVANMDQLSAIRLAVQSENPDFDAAMVDAYMADRLGLQAFIEGDDVSASDKVKMAMAHRDAVQKINALKVSAETPASLQQKAADAQNAAKRMETFTNVASTVSSASKTVAFELGDQLGKYEFNVPAEFMDVATKQLAELGAQGQWSLDEGGIRNAQAIFKSMVGAAYLDQIITSATKHAEAKAREAVLREMSGPAPSVGNKLPGTQAAPATQNHGGWSDKAPDPSFFTKNW